MTKLDAVNMILTKAGLYRVSVLDTNGASDATEAERVLDEEELRIQLEGWHYNMREDVELTPDSQTSKIYLPTGCLTIDSDQGDSWRNITQVGDYLYDRDDNTDEFTENLICSYTLRYSFECIPIEVRQYIAVQAACSFMENRPLTREKFARLGLLREDAQRARTRALQINGDREDANTLNTADAMATRGGRSRVLSIEGMGWYIP